MPAYSFRLHAAHEWVAHDPFGRPKPGDLGPGQDPASLLGDRVVLRAPRGGYVSFRVLVQGKGAYRLGVQIDGGLQADLFKCWYHPLANGAMSAPEGQPTTYWPDALLPVQEESEFTLPDPDNAIEGQTTQAFWVDVYVPAEVRPGTIRGAVNLVAGPSAVLRAGGERMTLPVTVEVMPLTVPDEPCIIMDHNSYGARWLWDMYPSVLAAAEKGPRGSGGRRSRSCTTTTGWCTSTAACFTTWATATRARLTRSMARAPSARGRDKTLVDWELYDRHYGPLLDGSAFESGGAGNAAPRAARRVRCASVYTPINPDWPASYSVVGRAGL